jgi:hypothetical protein
MYTDPSDNASSLHDPLLPWLLYGVASLSPLKLFLFWVFKAWKLAAIPFVVIDFQVDQKGT